jgi:hypothetical protein
MDIINKAREVILVFDQNSFKKIKKQSSGPVVHNVERLCVTIKKVAKGF